MPSLVELPKISIIIPSFNQGRFIGEAIDSVLSQNYLNIELIVMDGGSSDETVQVLKSYGSKVTWVSERDRGQAHAVNKGLDSCTGDIIGWLNSDDAYCPGAFKAVIKAFRDHPEVLVVHGNRILLDELSHVSGWTVQKQFAPPKSGFNVCSETAFWKYKSVSELRLREDLRFAMDLEFFCRLQKLGRFFKVSAYIGFFRCHADNKSSTISDVGRAEAERVWKILYGPHSEEWSLRHETSHLSLAVMLLRHPILIGIPYLYRRFCLKRRGL